MHVRVRPHTRRIYMDSLWLLASRQPREPAHQALSSANQPAHQALSSANQRPRHLVPGQLCVCVCVHVCVCVRVCVCVCVCISSPSFLHPHILPATCQAPTPLLAPRLDLRDYACMRASRLAHLIWFLFFSCLFFSWPIDAP